MGEENSTLDIENIATNLLDTDKLKEFLDFYDFLHKNKLGKKKTGRKISSYSWAITYKSRRIGGFKFHGNSWTIGLFNLFPAANWFEKIGKYLNAELIDFILANINSTSSCCVKGVCHSVENKIILGRLFNNRVCGCETVKLINPDDKALKYVKELVLIGKEIIA